MLLESNSSNIEEATEPEPESFFLRFASGSDPSLSQDLANILKGLTVQPSGEHKIDILWLESPDIPESSGPDLSELESLMINDLTVVAEDEQ